MEPKMIMSLNANILLASVILFSLMMGCDKRSLTVAHMPPPDYPVEALSAGMQGVVMVTVGIGTDGKVIYATGNGPNSILIKAAEHNAEGWIFEVPAHTTFPMEHQIKYSFKLNSSPTGNNLYPTIITDLPDTVEIVGTRVTGDKFLLIPPNSTQPPAKPAP